MLRKHPPPRHPPEPRHQQPPRVTTIAFDPTRHGRLLCATSEGNLTANTYPGCDIFSSDDNGSTWTHWVSRLLGTPMGAREDHHVLRRIAAITVAKRREGGSLVVFGAVSKGESLPADGGATWTPLCSSLPKGERCVYTSITGASIHSRLCDES